MIQYRFIKLKNIPKIKHGNSEYETEENIMQAAFAPEGADHWHIFSYYFDMFRREEFFICFGFENKEAFVLSSLCDACCIKKPLKQINKINKKYAPNILPLELEQNEFRAVYEDSRGHILSDEDLVFIDDENDPLNDNWVYKDKKTGKWKKAIRKGIIDNLYNYGRMPKDKKPLLNKFLKEYNVSLEDFIMNRKYIVITGIDSDEWKRYEDYGIFDESNIEFQMIG